MEERKPNAKALLPILVFLVLYLGSGIYFEYINPPEGGMGFYIISVVVAFPPMSRVSALPSVRTAIIASITLSASGLQPRCSNINDMAQKVPIGFAMPLPAMSRGT